LKWNRETCKAPDERRPKHPAWNPGREREAAEAACRANPAACLQEGGDPHWIWHLTVEQGQELAGAIVAARGYLTVTKLWDALST
jgi:hypothetical protein